LSVQTGRGVHPVRMGCPPLSIPGPKFSRPRRVNKRLSISHLYIYIYIYIYIYLCVRAQRGPSLQTSLFRDAHPLAREREGDAGISANTGEHVRVRGIGNTSRDAARLPARASFEPLSKKTGLVYSVPGTFERARARACGQSVPRVKRETTRRSKRDLLSLSLLSRARLMNDLHRAPSDRRQLSHREEGQGGEGRSTGARRLGPYAGCLPLALVPFRCVSPAGKAKGASVPRCEP